MGCPMTRIRQAAPGVPVRQIKGQWYDNQNNPVATPQFKDGQQAYKKIGNRYVSASGVVLEEIKKTEEPHTIVLDAQYWWNWNKAWEKREQNKKDAEAADTARKRQQDERSTQQIMDDWNIREISSMFEGDPELESAAIAMMRRSYPQHLANRDFWQMCKDTLTRERDAKERFSRLTMKEIRRLSVADLATKIGTTVEHVNSLLVGITAAEIDAAFGGTKK